jgi:hypothetical protein
VINILTDATNLISKLPEDKQNKLMKVLDKVLGYGTRLENYPEILRVLYANWLLHQIIAVLKRNNLDGPRPRQVALEVIQSVFNLKTWTPDWLFPAGRTEPGD